MSGEYGAVLGLYAVMFAGLSTFFMRISCRDLSASFSSSGVEVREIVQYAAFGSSVTLERPSSLSIFVMYASLCAGSIATTIFPIGVLCLFCL